MAGNASLTPTNSSRLLAVFKLAILVISPVCMFFVLSLYRNTVIDFRIILSIYIASGLLCLAAPRYVPGKNWHNKFFVCSLTIGNILAWLLLVLNFHLASGPIESRTMKIGYVGRNSSRMGGGQYTDVMINGKEKKLEHFVNTDLEKHSHVQLQIQKGLLGFYVILTKTATTDSVSVNQAEN